MKYYKENIKKGIEFHKINTNKFKTNLFAVFLTTPLKKETVTMNALMPLVLKRGTNRLNSQELISEKLEEMYGAGFDCGIEKSGNNQVIKFYVESLNDEYIPEKKDMIEESFNILFDIIFNPFIKENKFNKEYVEGEKNKLKKIIESKIDNKAGYAVDRCIEEMYKNKPYGLYKYGYIEDLENINEEKLFNYYNELVKKCKIDIFISGKVDKETIDKVKNNELIKKLNERQPDYIKNGDNEKKENLEIKVVEESMDVMQGKLVLGLDILNINEEEKYAVSIYNIILGGSANSKLFQNVREKASLAYTAGSSYLRQKNNILIRCGIEIQNYQKTVEIIKQQLKDMEEEKFNEDDINNAKNIIISTVDGIEDSQDSEISYYFSQELTSKFVSIEDYIKNINKVTKQDVAAIAKKIKINTIYFLKNN